MWTDLISNSKVMPKTSPLFKFKYLVNLLFGDISNEITDTNDINNFYIITITDTCFVLYYGGQNPIYVQNFGRIIMYYVYYQKHNKTTTIASLTSINIYDIFVNDKLTPAFQTVNIINVNTDIRINKSGIMDNILNIVNTSLSILERNSNINNNACPQKLNKLKFTLSLT